MLTVRWRANRTPENAGRWLTDRESWEGHLAEFIAHCYRNALRMHCSRKPAISGKRREACGRAAQRPAGKTNGAVPPTRLLFSFRPTWRSPCGRSARWCSVAVAAIQFSRHAADVVASNAKCCRLNRCIMSTTLTQNRFCLSMGCFGAIAAIVRQQRSPFVITPVIRCTDFFCMPLSGRRAVTGDKFAIDVPCPDASDRP
jgi:hypothetical protein